MAGSAAGLARCRMVNNHGQFLVAGLDSANVTRDIEASCLRETELQEAASIHNQRRREEWVAGRIAAKYAFLYAELSASFAGSGELSLRMLNRADLAAFSSEMYR